ncbi:MAG: helix-turn-helix transcriptional regulator [Legionella sp.]|nr:helix-turn-helix transcriptional regulator [Legionella sp.]
MDKHVFQIDIENLLWLAGQWGAFWKDCNSHYMGCNDIAAEKAQLKSRQDIVERTDFDLETLSLTEANQIRQGDKLVINTQKPHYFLYSATNSCNKSVFLTFKGPLWNINKKIVGVYGIDTFIDLFDEKSYLPILEKAGIPINDFKNLKSTIISQDSFKKNKNLTSRQYDCLYYLARGMTIKEIALQLKLSARTVEHYLEAIKDKLNCRTRSELIRVFLSKEVCAFHTTS